MNVRKKLATFTAVTAIVGSLGLGTVALAGGVVSAQAATPTTRADCANWQSYGFASRGACVASVIDNNANGYGGNGGNNGGTVGAIGQFIRTVLASIVQIFRAIFAFFF